MLSCKNDDEMVVLKENAVCALNDITDGTICRDYYKTTLRNNNGPFATWAFICKNSRGSYETLSAMAPMIPRGNFPYLSSLKESGTSPLDPPLRLLSPPF